MKNNSNNNHNHHQDHPQSQEHQQEQPPVPQSVLSILNKNGNLTNNTTTTAIAPNTRRSPSCEKVWNTTEFLQTCQESFFQQNNHCQRLSSIQQRISNQWKWSKNDGEDETSSSSSSNHHHSTNRYMNSNGNNTNSNTNVTTDSTITCCCKTLWITGISMGFDNFYHPHSNNNHTKKHAVADGGDGYRVQYAAALKSAQIHALHILQPMVVLLTPPPPKPTSSNQTTNINGTFTQQQTNRQTTQKIQAYQRWLQDQGVIVLQIHSLSFQDLVFQAYPEYATNGAIAYYLRLDLPHILREHYLPFITTNQKNQIDSTSLCDVETIFYTDSDVLFVNHIPPDEFEFIKSRTDATYFLQYGHDYLLNRPRPGNTGIMFMHLPGFENAFQDRILPWGHNLANQQNQRQKQQKQRLVFPSTNHDGTTIYSWFPAHDQMWLNHYYDKPYKWRNENRLLPPTWNWKVFWEVEESQSQQQSHHDVDNTQRTKTTGSEIRIVHFHGPKPNDGVNQAASCDLSSIHIHNNNNTTSTIPTATIRQPPFPSAYTMLVAASICCDHGKMSHHMLQLYEQWKPSKEVIALWS